MSGQSEAWAPVLDFWFAPRMEERWFIKDPTFDAEVRAKLLTPYEAAAAGRCEEWAEAAHGALALVILLDQVPRNLFRNDPRAFACDAEALRIARQAIEQSHDQTLSQVERLFLYMPFEHSESLADQEDCIRLTSALDENPEWLDYAIRHRDIIARFGRFPHRNAVLGRVCTAEEEAFLAEPGSSF